MKYKYVKPGHVMTDPSWDSIIRYLDKKGDLIDKKYKRVDTLTDEKILKAYRYMVLSREQDDYMSQLQLQGKMLTFAPNYGEEALQAAAAMPMKKGDWFVPAFRSNVTMLYLGVPLKNQLLYWNGNENGNKMPKDVNVLPVNIPIGTQTSHATGLAFGMRHKGNKNVSVSFIGNGGTSEGEYFEAMNFASIHKLPTVFCVNNNQWSISTPSHLERASSTIASDGYAMGIPGLRVDGNDLLASYEVMEEALEYARSGNGPVLVEFVTWRQGKHTTSDDPTVYRTREVEKKHEEWEPFHRIEKYILDNKIASKKDLEKIAEDVKPEVRKAYEESLVNIDETIDEIFDYTYATLSKDLLKQKAEAEAFFKKGSK
ncbi:pyruvate dehydrogenase (acetyl-transferring) E1 component subunit alpha [[Mycoplasma] mobile]|uniref:Pyruvate dehydrogenase E1 component subunit alpha n=1 Tax=Mycoplasma mobile (strain ATCC 43663 / 163K / NCTC 11711) TaxID=267748 RepID=Q6KH61_MYCM1|nr:pyruvate dehydrogenase (acetyl-transferring) E1 component subunit alpha [[Mycoplasma] mobile]AAT28070.1 pyruvate dehydrogenase E1 component alpha subunit [Mycoplasma mobile 163K]